MMDENRGYFNFDVLFPKPDNLNHVQIQLSTADHIIKERKLMDHDVMKTKADENSP